MLTEDEIVNAYRYFLGRLPESAQVIADLRSRIATFEELRNEFIGSAEFRSQLPNHKPPKPRSKPLTWPKIAVEYASSGPAVERMLEHVQNNWQLLGLSEPHWSVLSADEFRASRIHDSEDSFYASGEVLLQILDSALKRADLAPDLFSTCFELGCGLGRATTWLAGRFERVIAMDISLPHLRLAETRARDLTIENIDFRHLGSIDDIPAAGSFDIFVSVIVLQHNPPPIIAALLRTILDRLAPGGVAYFQLSTYHRHYRFAMGEYLDQLRPDGSIEMHVLPQAALFAVIAAGDCDVLEIREDDWTGQQDGISNTLLVRKRVASVDGR